MAFLASSAEWMPYSDVASSGSCGWDAGEGGEAFMEVYLDLADGLDTVFGLFVGLNDEIDGMIHLSDIAWDKSGEEAVKDYAKGQEIQAKIIDVDVEKERISLGIKQLTEDENYEEAARVNEILQRKAT